MKTMGAFLVLLLSSLAFAQTKPAPTTLRGVLLEQLQSTHNRNDWFVSVDTAVDGLTPEQANWKEGNGNHSVGQLTYHLLYWDRRSLKRIQGKPLDKFSGNNDDTFNGYDPKKWDETVKELDQVMTDYEKFVETADEATLQKHASEIAHVGAHNAYHIGEMVSMRKLQGSWNPDKGVK
jgi:uncharacterized damage-inducible protein DinB